VAGELIGIAITPARGGDLTALDEIEAVAGRGLVGDRYFVPEGVQREDKQITLTEAEAFEAVASEYDIRLAAHDLRRNLLTRGVSLNELVGREFRVGEVRLRGVDLCEPCQGIEKRNVPGTLKAFLGRGGLRAEIVAGGTLRVGDEIDVG
jgi:MOSC domain-containing protein YiiM